MNKGIIAGIIAAIIVIGGVLASPIFYDTEVDEALPVSLNEIREGLTLEKFSEMNDESRDVLVVAMPQKLKDMIMDESAKTQTVISEEMDNSSEPKILKTGQFDGLAGHFAEGDAKILEVSGTQYLRFENFEVTNGPDLRVYVTQGGDIKQGIQLDKLTEAKSTDSHLRKRNM